MKTIHATGFVVYLLLALMGCKPDQQKNIDKYPVYQGTDLGMTYHVSGTDFRIWAPTASEARLLLYASVKGGDALQKVALTKAENGTWIGHLDGDQAGKYYTFQVKIDGQWLAETPGPYVQAVGVNGKRGAIVDLQTTNPDGWASDRRPPLKSYNDIIIYEIHIRDMSIAPNSGIKHKGKFIGLTETGTRSPEGEKTGLDHLKDLGITHVHIMPMFDFRSIDETRLDEPQFNWGYEPQNYNVPEGSYATDPYDPAARIRELKQLIQTLHANGIRVIMDVVYNHTGFGDDSKFNLSLLTPKYFYRYNADGSPSNASGCGNETASERPMMRKFIMESVKYWAEAYHIDGFRFDLMGVHDITTMNDLSDMLRKIDPSIFVYGEGWTAGSSPLPARQAATKSNVLKMPHIAAFSDEIRDGLKGSWNDWKSPGFVSGNASRIAGVKFGIVGAIAHPQINYANVHESDTAWANTPAQCIDYVSCHDNHTLYDKLKIANPDATEEDILRMHVLANTVVLTSQGVPFLHAGVDFVRTKQGVENSYNAPDSINQIDWSRKAQYKQIFNFYKNMIALRKAHPAFRMPTAKMVRKYLHFMPFDENQALISYTLSPNANGDSWKNIIVLLNGSPKNKTIKIPDGSWAKVVQGTRVDESGFNPFEGDEIEVPAHTATILTDAKSLLAN